MRHTALLSLIVGGLSCCACSSAPAINGSKREPRLSGTFALASDWRGHLAVVPTSCAAGDREVFFFTDFQDEKAGVTVRLVVHARENPSVRVFSSATPLENIAVFTRPECRVFRFSYGTPWSGTVSVARTGPNIESYSPGLELDCSNGDGDSIIGKVSIAHCD